MTRRTSWQVTVLVVVVLFAYGPVRDAGFIWDDDLWIENNTSLRDLAGLRSNWLEPETTPQYYPMMLSVLWLEWQLWGDDPGPYHLVNILLHIVNALLLWRLLLVLGFCARGSDARAPPWPAYLTALVFALHPVCVESVAWVSELKNTLSLLFALLTLLAYLRFDPLVTPAAERSWRAWAAAFALFFCALASKTIMASVPAVYLVLRAWRVGKLTRRDVWPLLPFFLLGIAAGLTTAGIERTHTVGILQLSVPQRLLLAGTVPWVYLTKLWLPWELCFIYPRWTPTPLSGQAVFPLATLLLLLVAWRARRRYGRGPLCAILIYGGILFPVLGFLQVYPFRFSWIADHFQYHAAPAALALIVAGGVHLARRLPARWTPALQVVLALGLLALGARTAAHARWFKDPETLWRATLAHNPDAWLAHNNLGGIEAKRGRIESACASFQRAVDLAPDVPTHQLNLAWALSRLGRAAAAERHYARAIELSPDAAPPQFFLGEHHLRRNELKRAHAAFSAACRLDPHSARVHARLAVVLRRLGQGDAANAHAQEARRLVGD